MSVWYPDQTHQAVYGQQGSKTEQSKQSRCYQMNGRHKLLCNFDISQIWPQLI